MTFMPNFFCEYFISCIVCDDDTMLLKVYLDFAKGVFFRFIFTYYCVCNILQYWKRNKNHYIWDNV